VDTRFKPDFSVTSAASPTIREVAERAGVSVATVSRVMNLSGPVSDKTRQSVNRAIRESGFRPNSIGRQLKTARTHTIGVLVPSLRNPIFADAVAGVELAAKQRGFGVLLASSDYDAEKETSAIETFLRNRVEGLVLTVADEENSEALDNLSATQVPFVLMFNPVKRKRFSTVSIDNREAATELVQSLIKLGHQRIAMISGKGTESDRSKERQAGYMDALRSGGIGWSQLTEVGFGNSDPESLIKVSYNAHDAPTAYFCSTDVLALSMIRALTSINKRIPEDISVVGFDGISIGHWAIPSLATAVQPAEQMGEWAAQHLVGRIDNDEPATNLVLPYTIRHGESIAPPTKR